MGILKKIWNWLSTDVTKGFQKSYEDFMLKYKTKKWEEYKARKLEEIKVTKKEIENIKQEISKYATGGYIKNAERYVAPEEFYRREGIKIKGGVNTPPTTPRPEFTPHHKILQEILKGKLMNILDSNKLEGKPMIIS